MFDVKGILELLHLFMKGGFAFRIHIAETRCFHTEVRKHDNFPLHMLDPYVGKKGKGNFTSLRWCSFILCW